MYEGKGRRMFLQMLVEIHHGRVYAEWVHAL